jgi:ribose transport system substrate-binding protein
MNGSSSTRYRRAVIGAVVAGVCVVTAACSSSGGSSPSSSAGSSTVSGSSTAAGSDSLAAAKAYVTAHLASPGSILLTQALSKKPSHQLIVNLTLPNVPTDTVFTAGLQEAATTLGWSYKNIAIDSSATGIQNAFEAALQVQPKPIAIATLALSVDSFRPQLAEAKAKGIAVIATSDIDVPGSPGTDGLVARIQGGPTEAEWGQQLAAYIAADSNGTGQVALFSIPSYPILKAYDGGLVDGLKTYCPNCKLTSVDQQTTDLGTKTPQSIVSTLVRNPKIKYIVVGFGDMMLGVHAALSAAGISGVKILGVAPDPSDLEAVRNGTETAWVGTPIAYLGWRAVDAAARFANGDSETETDAAADPAQLLTADTIKSAVFDSAGNYVGDANYKQQFKALWHVS